MRGTERIRHFTSPYDVSQENDRRSGYKQLLNNELGTTLGYINEVIQERE